MQQKKKIDMVEELQEDVKSIVPGIRPIQVEVMQTMEPAQVITSTHITVEVVEKISKSKEVVQLHVKQVKKVCQDFELKLNTPSLSF